MPDLVDFEVPCAEGDELTFWRVLVAIYPFPWHAGIAALIGIPWSFTFVTPRTGIVERILAAVLASSLSLYPGGRHGRAYLSAHELGDRGRSVRSLGAFLITDADDRLI